MAQDVEEKVRRELAAALSELAIYKDMFRVRLDRIEARIERIENKLEPHGFVAKTKATGPRQ